MGRPPCCDKVGIKKGPWTPEEDIILVSYIQEHGPGNWRAVPTNTGLLRCSKSCRLRWTNYLRPGIKRGNFTPHEEGMIIHLQALLGNKWAAIATYLPQRTDNDIKNYWNTHLKKKLKKLQLPPFEAPPPMQMAAASQDSTFYRQFISKSYNGAERIIDNNNHKNQSGGGVVVSENSSVYASSAENISRLLEGWMRSSPPHANNNINNNSSTSNLTENCDKFYCDFGKLIPTTDHQSSGVASTSLQCYRPQEIEHQGENGNIPNDELESILSFDDHHRDLISNMANCEKSKVRFVHDHKAKIENNNNIPPLSFLEKWLLDESAGQVEGVMELPPIF
ncbi:hypothetical protein ACP275_10G149400 [Erythranthe tilingii]